MHPEMNQADINILSERLKQLAKGLDRDLKILEWGAGGSTVYFSNQLRIADIPFSWVSLEYNKGWFERVTHEVGPEVKVVLFDVGNNERAQVKTNMDEYISYPASLNEKFDFILVDGRKRRRCLLEAAKLLNPGGRAYLHDAERVHYHSAFSAYKSHRFLLSSLWEGQQD